MGTVKYTGPVASFHCPTEATIRSLKVHFSPKQLGEGTPSPENIRPIKGWDGVTVHNDKDGIVIPEEYQKVEYLESDGGQYFWTDINVQEGLTVKSVQSFLGTQDNYLFGGTVDSANNRSCFNGMYNRHVQGAYPNSYYNTNHSLSLNTVYRIKTTHKDGIITVDVDGVSTYTQNRSGTIVESGRKCICFGSSNGAGDVLARYLYRGRVYSLTVKKGEDCLANYIPCRRKSDNKPGMYDTVSGEFFTNQGTGEFICGPDVGETVKYEFGVLGKNKLDKNNYKYLNSSTICFGGTASAESVDGSLFLKAGTYTFSVSTTANVIFASDANKKNIAFATNTNTATFTLPESIAIRIGCFIQDVTDEEMLAYNYQLELGSTATAYEPYNPNKTVYGGWVDLITGEVCDNWWTNTFEIAADEGTVQTSGLRRIAKNLPSAHLCDTDQRTKSVCSQLLYLSQSNDSRPNFSLSKNTAYMYIPNDNTAYTFEIFYPSLTTSATYQIAPTQLQTFLSTNNIWSNADYVEVEYDLHETQTILARKQFIIANQPHVVKPAAAPLQNFVTDMKAPLKECKVYFGPVQDLHGYGKPWVGGAGKNLFNMATSTPKRYIDSSGNINVSNDWSASDFIKAKAETTYALTAPTSASSNTARIAFYDSNQELISSLGAQEVEANNNIFTTPVDTVYIRISVRTETPTDVQLEVGSTAKSYEPYENICPISGWTKVTTSLNRAPLPEEYQEVECVENTSANSYFITDYYPNDKTNFYADLWFRYDSNAEYPSTLFSAGSTYHFYKTGYYSWKYVKGTAEASTTGYTVYRSRIQASTNNSKLTIVDSDKTRSYTISSTETFQSEKPLILFATESNDVIKGRYRSTDTSKLYRFTLYENEKTVRDYVPCYRKSDNEVGLYDLVNKTFLTHSGEGTFNAGPDITTGSIAYANWSDSAGTVYGGYIDVKNGELVQTHYVAVVDENTAITQERTSHGVKTEIYNLPYAGTNENAIYTNGYGIRERSSASWNYPAASRLFLYPVNGNVAYVVIGIPDINMTQAEWTDWLSEHGPIQICYKLADPIHYSLSPTTLKTLRGTNNIWASNGGDNIEIAYWKH